jgi:hypothetical protein
MTDQEQEPWPEKMYLLHPSIKTFGAMVSNPERREYVRADRIEELNERLTAATDDAKEAEAYAEQLEARNKELTLQLLATHGQAADALAKLTKAEAYLQKISRHANRSCAAIAAHALAELEGGE